MAENIEIKIVIEPSLIKYFEEGISKRHINCSTEEELSEFLSAVLNDSMYPIASKQTSEHEIHLSYRPRSFADPIF